ncbi:MAG: MFS transporter [Corynebacteriales bacterium]|nr:MFS transporter [Mycobacteriales bacterium]
MTASVLTSAPVSVKPVSSAPWRALPLLLIGAFLPMLDAFIVNVALTSIGSSLHASSAALELTVAGYGLAYACTLVAGGRLGDKFGRRRLFLIGMAGFTITSAACGLAPGIGVLIAFRILQGFTAALMYPQVLGAIQAGFSGADRQKAVAAFGATAGASAAIGQLLGGVLLSADLWGGWRPLFLINVPIGIVGFILSIRMIPETKAEKSAPIDVRGGIGLAATISLLLIPLTFGRTSGWPLWAWLSLAAVVPVGAIFIAAQRRMENAGRTPLLPPSLLRIHLARQALIALALFATCIGGFLFTMTLILQVGHGFSPIEAGLTMAPCTLSFFGMALYAGKLTARFGAKFLVASATVFAGGVALFGAIAAAAGSSLTVVEAAAPLAIVGFGWAGALLPLIGYTLTGLPANRAGLAGGVLSTTMQVSLALGAAALGSLIYMVVGSHPDAMAWRTGTLVVVGVETTLALATAFACSRLRHSIA